MRTKFSQKVLKKLVHEKLSEKVKIIPASEGISTNVYEIRNKGNIYYLRISGYKNQSFTPEVIAHKKALARGAKVSQIVYYRNFCSEIDNRSFIITKEIPGKPVSSYSNWQELKQVFIKAGKDLAKINSVHVRGFGWIKRKEKELKKLTGSHKTYENFILSNFDKNINTLKRKKIITKKEFKTISSLKDIIKNFLVYDQACLGHGDFDVTHIYSNNRAYTGIIDLGDIRGVSKFYDLAHFKIFSHPIDKVFPWLLQGYNQITQLPENTDLHLTIEGTLIAIDKLSWIAENLSENIPNHHAIPKLKNNIKDLENCF